MSRQIACGHCGQSHGSVAEVRSCSLSNPSEQPFPGAPPEDSTSDTSPGGSAPARVRPPTKRKPASKASPTASGSSRSAPTRGRQQKSSPATSLERHPTWLAGPPELGRSVVIGPDDEVPEPWVGLTEVAASAEADSTIVERLHHAWRTRERLVIRWSGPLPDPEPVVDKPFFQLSVDEQLPGERLAFAVTANAVNLMHGKVLFSPLHRALDLGGRLADDSGADLQLDGASDEPGPVWVDGGPTDLGLAGQIGCRIVPRVHLVAGSLRATSPSNPPSADLADDQLAAVSHRSGPARILAPAGSGKTRVLTERARHLVRDCGIEARSVSLVAYNRRAKDEMRDRLDDIAGLDIRTLNSLALAVAIGSGPFRQPSSDRRTSPTTITELEVRRMLDRVVPGRRRKKLADPLEPWIDALSACRLGLRDPDEIEAAYGGDVAGFPEVLAQYRQNLAKANALDFDEQILRAIDRLLTDVDVRRTARAVAPLLLIDEFQDLTPAHLLLLRIIAGPAAEAFAVGDDDQTIYGYAGASPDWLIEFDRFFPGAVDHRLTVNYRCPADVVEAATNVLSYNRRRVTKEISAAAGPETNGLTVLTKGDPQENLVSHVESLVASGANPADIAVLTRVNAALLPAAVYLEQAGLPVVRPYGLTSDVLDRSGVGAAMSWLRLATGPAQSFGSDDLRLALRRPPRSLHPRVADWACEQESVKHLLTLAQRLNTEREADTITAFAEDIQELRHGAESGLPTAELLERVFDEVGLLGAASQLDRSQRSARRAAHADELAALTAVARLHPEPKGFETWLRSSIDSIPRFDPEQPVEGITLATIHTTKGLEWPHVIVHDARDGLFPHRLADDEEEERRIFHVGITRGRETVAVTVSGPPSPFVTELGQARPSDLPWADQPGDKAALVRSASAPKGAAAARSERPERSEPSSASEATLRDALTAWRRERCQSDAVPAYVVLDNKTLDAIAATAPTNLAELGAISGIGPAKLERYGADILGIVGSA